MISHPAWAVLADMIRKRPNQHSPRRGSRTFFWFAPARQSRFVSVVGFGIGVATWQVASMFVANVTILPGPIAAGQALWQLADWQLLRNVLITLRRVTIAFGLAAIVGVSTGILAGLFPRFGALLMPVNSALRYIPPTAFIGLTIVWFGVYETSKVALIVIGIVFYIIQMTVDVVKTFPRSLVEAALNLGATNLETLGQVVLPHLAPDLLAVLRVNMGAAWTFVVVAEVVSAQAGLGNMMAVSQRFLATPNLFALLFLVGVLGYLTDRAFAALIRYASPWRTA